MKLCISVVATLFLLTVWKLEQCHHRNNHCGRQLCVHQHDERQGCLLPSRPVATHHHETHLCFAHF
jgi:hypothetical protein